MIDEIDDEEEDPYLNKYEKIDSDEEDEKNNNNNNN